MACRPGHKTGSDRLTNVVLIEGGIYSAAAFHPLNISICCIAHISLNSKTSSAFPVKPTLNNLFSHLFARLSRRKRSPPPFFFSSRAKTFLTGRRREKITSSFGVVSWLIQIFVLLSDWQTHKQIHIPKPGMSHWKKISAKKRYVVVYNGIGVSPENRMFGFYLQLYLALFCFVSFLNKMESVRVALVVVMLVDSTKAGTIFIGSSNPF